MSSEYTVFVVDDDEPIRDSISMLLETVGLACRTFQDAAEFLDYYSPELEGCLVLDVRMPGMSGLELQQRLLEQDAALPVVFITGHGDIPMAVEAMKHGAVDFVRKPFRDEDLLTSIKEAMEVGATRWQEHSDLADAKAKVALLTPRESEVFARVAAGSANKVTAIELGISERTVEIHRSQVMQKTGSRTLADLVRLKLLLEFSG